MADKPRHFYRILSAGMKYPIETIRHSTAHIMAAAICELFPGTKLGVGPVIEHGFYYDMDAPKPITTDDLVAIEARMQEIVKRNDAFVVEEMSIDDAIAFFEKAGQLYKVELLRDLKEKGTTSVRVDEAQDLPTGQAGVDAEKPSVVTIYKTGAFTDLCRGPHVGASSHIGVFKLTKLAGAYWRGNENNKQLQRIYGLAFLKQSELDAHLMQIAEAEKRDHRKLGKELGLFALIDEIGSGLPLFYPKGTILRRLIENLITELQESRGYQPIWIPHITKQKLYEMSGHLQKYDAMYPPMDLKGEDAYYLKPMNCPHFMMLYKTEQHSYRELPMRWVCTTTNYRYEKSGELSGLTRVRALTQDDCHVFAMPDQIESEINVMLDMLAELYKIFGFTDFWVRISTHDPKHVDHYIGDKEVWAQSEAALKRLIEKRGWSHEIGVGEAAFYGPKLDFMFKDAIGRQWQLSTIQLDMNLPNRFELEYTDASGEKKRPVVIHRALLGSTERFLGILIEHFAGAFPFWLAPEQVSIASVAERHIDVAKALQAEFQKHGIRAGLDASNESVGKKVRLAEMQKIPYSIVVGDKEAPADGIWHDDVMIAVRAHGSKDADMVSLGQCIANMLTLVRERRLK